MAKGHPPLGDWARSLRVAHFGALVTFVVKIRAAGGRCFEIPSF
jgi:hypothetical protein